MGFILLILKSTTIVEECNKDSKGLFCPGVGIWRTWSILSSLPRQEMALLRLRAKPTVHLTRADARTRLDGLSPRNGTRQEFQKVNQGGGNPVQRGVGSPGFEFHSQGCTADRAEKFAAARS
jgi:hypothetical protein